MASANILSASVIFFFVSASFDCASASERSLSSTSRFETMPWPSSDLRFSKDSLAIFTFASSKGSTFSRLSLYCFVAVTRSSLTFAILSLLVLGARQPSQQKACNHRGNEAIANHRATSRSIRGIGAKSHYTPSSRNFQYLLPLDLGLSPGKRLCLT